MAHIKPTIEPIPESVASAIEQQFHIVIRERAAVYIEQHKINLPDLSDYAKGGNRETWFPVPGMYGGFSYYFERGGEDALLVCASWSRVVEGSGMRHNITATGSTLVEEGFV